MLKELIGNKQLSTRNSRIFVSSLQTSDGYHLEEGLGELATLLSMGGGSEELLRAALKRIVPEFRPAGPTDQPDAGPIIHKHGVSR